MTLLVPIAMFGWIPLGLSLFWFLPVRKAIIAGYLIGWLFLPQAGYPIAGLPDYTRMTAVGAVIFLGALLVDPRRLLSVRPCIYDLPMLIWCTSCLPTSLSNGLNGLGFYDGLSGVLEMFLTWGAPYWLGRVYFSDWQSIRLLAIGVFIGGLICVPLCLWEIRMSPQLHRILYGYNPTKFHMAWRLGGYRPMLFMQHGIAVGLWMCTTALVGIWLWCTGTIKRLGGWPVSWLAVGLLVTAVLCRSLSALALLSMAAATLALARFLRARVALLVLFCLPALYVCLRAPQIWYPARFVAVAERIDAERARSFESRLHQEELLTVKAWRRPFLGWGSWERNRVYDEQGDRVVTDSLWIITFGQSGLVGLVSLLSLFALPGLLLWRVLRLDDWWAASTAAAAVLSLCVTMYAGDSLMNGMLNPVFHVLIGAVIGFALSVSEVRQTTPSMRLAAVTRRKRNSLSTVTRKNGEVGREKWAWR